MNSNLPEISIIVPTFKRVDQTKKTLSLLYKSNGWNSVYIPQVVIADSTEDKSIEKMILTFSHPAPVYVRPEKPGIAANKNAGAGKAESEVLIFCDSDMEVDSDTLLNTLIYLKEHKNIAMVGGRVIWKGGDRDGMADRPREEDRIRQVEGANYIEAIYSRFMATYKSIFWRVGGYDEEVFNMRGEGSDLSIRYWRSGFPLGYSEKIIVHHENETEGAVTRGIDHPERGIIKDLIQLGYKYGLSSTDSPNFAKTLEWITKDFKDRDKYIIIESIVNLLPYFWEKREEIEASRLNIPSEYDFKFLDVFTKKNLFSDCIGKAKEKIRDARERAFRI